MVGTIASESTTILAKVNHGASTVRFVENEMIYKLRACIWTLLDVTDKFIGV